MNYCYKCLYVYIYIYLSIYLSIYIYLYGVICGGGGGGIYIYLCVEKLHTLKHHIEKRSGLVHFLPFFPGIWQKMRVVQILADDTHGLKNNPLGGKKPQHQTPKTETNRWPLTLFCEYGLNTS